MLLNFNSLNNNINKTDLLKNYNILNLITENVEELICITSLDGSILYNTSSYNKMLGYSGSELLGRNISEFIHKDHLKKYSNFISDLIKINAAPNIQCKYKSSDGSYIWLKISGKILKEDIHGFSGMMFTSQDISKEVSNANALLESEEKFKCLVEELPFAIFICENNKYVFANNTGLRYLGLTSIDKIKNKVVGSFFKPHDDYTEKYHDTVINNLRNGTLEPTEEKLIRLCDNELIECETSSIKFPHVKNDSVLIICQNISERKKAESLKKHIDEKNKLLNKAKEFEKIRTDFFANISHELRTPINVMYAALQMLNLEIHTSNDSDFESSCNKRINVIKQNCYRLMRLINNIIDANKIDAGYFNLNLSNHNIVSVLEDMTMSVASFVETKNINFIFDTDVEEKFISCDVDKIERILLNLISNAVKFTPPSGNISVIVNDLKDYIKVSVIDSGSGIALEKQKNIFERFVQVDDSLVKRSEGSGIGLNLVKSLVEIHGGSIKLSSALGKGSEFTFTIPCTEVSTDISTNLMTAPLNSCDSKDNIKCVQIEFSDIYI